GVSWVQYRLDGAQSAQLAPGSPGLTKLVTGEGTHMFETRAQDVAGNMSQWRVQERGIDSTQPAGTSIPPAANSRTNTRTFTLSGDDPLPGSGVATIEYTIDGVAGTPLPGNGTITVASDGTHTIWHRVIDAAGQASPGVSTTFTIDTVAPVNTSGA